MEMVSLTETNLNNQFRSKVLVLENEKSDLRKQLIQVTEEFAQLKQLFDQSREQLEAENQIYQDTVLKLNEAKARIKLEAFQNEEYKQENDHLRS